MYAWIQNLYNLGKTNFNWHLNMRTFLTALDGFLSGVESEIEDARDGNDSLSLKLDIMDADRLGIKNEVVAARGTASGLASRIGVALNPDGSLKSSAPVGNAWNDAPAVTRESSTAFSVSGDLTAIFASGRAVRLHAGDGGTTDGYVAGATYSSSDDATTVEVSCAVPAVLASVQYGQEVANSPLTPAVAMQPLVSGVPSSINEQAAQSITVTRSDGTNYTSEVEFVVKAVKADESELTGWTAEFDSGSTVVLTPPDVDVDTPVSLYLRATEGVLGQGAWSTPVEVTVVYVPSVADNPVTVTGATPGDPETATQGAEEADWINGQPNGVFDATDHELTFVSYSGGTLVLSHATESGMIATGDLFIVRPSGSDTCEIISGTVVESGTGPYTYTITGLSSAPASVAQAWELPAFFMGTGGTINVPQTGETLGVVSGSGTSLVVTHSDSGVISIGTDVRLNGSEDVEVTAVTESDTTVNVGNTDAADTTGASAYTSVDRSWKLENGETYDALGGFFGTAATAKLKIVKRVTAGTYQTVAEVSFTATASPTVIQWADLAADYTVPDTGDYYVAAYNTDPTTGARCWDADGGARAYIAGEITTSETSGVTEDVSGTSPTMARKKLKQYSCTINPAASESVTSAVVLDDPLRGERIVHETALTVDNHSGTALDVTYSVSGLVAVDQHTGITLNGSINATIASTGDETDNGEGTYSAEITLSADPGVTVTTASIPSRFLATAETPSICTRSDGTGGEDVLTVAYAEREPAQSFMSVAVDMPDCEAATFDAIINLNKGA